MKKVLKNSTDNNNKNSRLTILSLINQLPGVRYNDLARITQHNNGVISYSLCTLEKNYCIKAIRCSNAKITRYFSISISDKYCPVIGYLKNETTRKIILFLYYNGESNFKKIQLHINKASSTTFWNLKRLLDDNIIVRLKTKKNNCYFIKNPSLVDKVIQTFDDLLLDRDTEITKLRIRA